MANSTGLSGARIWLSGSLPDEAGPEEAAKFTDWVKTFAKAAFRDGAQVLHGFHESITPALLEAAQGFRTSRNRKAPLSLFVSTYFRDKASGGYGKYSVAELERDCELRQIPQATTLDRSLADLRNALASHSDVLVAIGGKWWEQDRSHAGVPSEFLLAVARGIPVFLLGSLGGATSGYLTQHPEILKHLRNGLDLKANEALAAETDTGVIVRTVLEQICRLPLGRRETEFGQRFRILCLDGGGIRGAFTAAALARWEEMSGLRVADHFDLIAGTSTGGILAIGLGLGLAARDIVEFYRKQGPEIFPMTGFWERLRRGAARLTTNKFDASVLEQKLSLAYDRGGKPAILGDSPQRLLITSYNLTSNDLRLYRTSHHPNVQGHDHLRAVVVARATSAAPTYFEPATVDEQIAPHEAVDGGVWAISPTIAALGEAVGVLKIPLDRIEVLSVGTAAMPTFVENPGVQGEVGWGPKAPDLLMNAQMDATLLYMQQLLGDRFVRIDDKRPRVDVMDDPGYLEFLIVKGANVGEAVADQVLQRFVNGVSAARWRNV